MLPLEWKNIDHKRAVLFLTTKNGPKITRTKKTLRGAKRDYESATTGALSLSSDVCCWRDEREIEIVFMLMDISLVMFFVMFFVPFLLKNGQKMTKIDTHSTKKKTPLGRTTNCKKKRGR